MMKYRFFLIKKSQTKKLADIALSSETKKRFAVEARKVQITSIKITRDVSVEICSRN